jgi:hypothetical protein
LAVRAWEVRRDDPRGTTGIPGITRVIVALAETMILLAVFTVSAAVLLPLAWWGRGRPAK